MKATRIPIAAGFLLVSTAIAFAQHRPARKSAQRQSHEQPQMQPHKPSDLLSMFFRNNLDRILSPIDRSVPLPRARVTELREQFIDQGSKAPEPKKPMYEAAIAVCNAVSEAMDEREKAIASLQGSVAVHAPSDLGAHRKDIPSRGGLGTAMLADATLRREAHEEANRKQEARQTDNFFTVQQKNQWTQRALQLRQQTDRLAAREREAERATEQATTAGAGIASTAGTVTLDKAVQVKVKYGTATIPAGTTLTIVSRDANGVIVEYMGENVLLPP